MTPTVRVGCGVMVLDGNKILLQKSNPAYRGKDTWEVAGGHVELGETIEQAIIRETLEEFCITATEVEIVCVCNQIYSPTKHYISFGGVVRKWHGTPKLGEPDKFTELKWFDFDDLPDNFFKPSLQVINTYKSGRWFANGTV